MNRLTYKFESVSALTGAGGQYGPDAFAPGSAPFASRTLGNVAVYDNKAYGLLSEIIGRFNARRCDKPEIRLAVITETTCKVLSWATVGNIVQCNAKEGVSAFFHRLCKIAGRTFFGLVKDVKHLAHCIQQSLAVCGGCFVRQTRQIFQFPNQMCQAKLHQDITVLMPPSKVGGARKCARFFHK